MNPVLEPAFLYGGFPPNALRNHFLEAAPSNALPLDSQGFPQELEVIDLPGHSFDMIGLRTPDDVVFLADALVSEEAIQKYQVSFLYDVKGYLATLQKVEQMQARLFIPSHAAATEEIAPLARANREKIVQIIEYLLNLCQAPHSFEEILQAVFHQYALTMDCNQYVLVGSTVRSYLAYLYQQQKLSFRFVSNRMLWQTQPEQQDE